jgi:hypothetical protein
MTPIDELAQLIEPQLLIAARSSASLPWYQRKIAPFLVPILLRLAIQIALLAFGAAFRYVWDRWFKALLEDQVSAELQPRIDLVDRVLHYSPAKFYPEAIAAQPPRPLDVRMFL